MLGVKEHQRRSTIKTFELVDVKEVAERNLAVRYDSSNGYLGYALKSGTVQVEASQFDRLLVIRRDGTYQIIDAPEKEFVGKGMLYCGFADKELLKEITFTVIYQEKTYKYLFLKRCQILSWQLKKAYPLIPEGNFKLVKLSTFPNAELTITYKPKPGLRILEEKVYFSDYLTKGVRAGGVRIAVKEVASLRLRSVKEVVRSGEEQPSLFDEEEV